MKNANIKQPLPKASDDDYEGVAGTPTLSAHLPEPSDDDYESVAGTPTLSAHLPEPSDDDYEGVAGTPNLSTHLPEPSDNDYEGSADAKKQDMHSPEPNGCVINDTERKTPQNTQAEFPAVIKNIPYYLKQEVLKSFFVKADTKMRRLYIYNQKMGYFVPMSEIDFWVWLNKYICAEDSCIAKRVTTNVVHQTFMNLLTTPEIQATADDMDPNQDFVNTLDCVLNVRTREVLDHSPKYLFVNVLNGRWLGENYQEPKAYKSWLKKLAPDKEFRDLLVSTIGYMLSNYHCAKRFFYLFGKPDSGKSGLLHIMEALVGEHVTSHLAMEDLSNEHYSVELYGMKINTCGERERGKTMKKTKILKQLTGGDMIEANPKGRKHVQFRGKTKLYYTANDPMQIAPQIDEPALWRRLIAMETPYSIPAAEQIPGYAEKLLAKEGDRILSYHLKKIRETLDGDMYTFHLDIGTKRLMASLQRDTSSVVLFLKEWCRLDPSQKATIQALIARYHEYCSRYNLMPVSDRQFGTVVKAAYPQLDSVRIHTTGDNPIWGLKGIQLREDI